MTLLEHDYDRRGGLPPASSELAAPIAPARPNCEPAAITAAPDLFPPPEGWGVVAGHPSPFVPCHREGHAGEPAFALLSVRFPVSRVDLEAVLWLGLETGLTVAELEDSRFPHQFVLDTLINAGLAEVEEARLRLSEVRPSDSGWAQVLYVRGRVAQLYSNSSGPARPQGTGGRP